MSLEGKTIKKAARKSRWAKYRERNMAYDEFDKANKGPKVIAKSNRIYSLLRKIQRRLDRSFGVNTEAMKPSMNFVANATSLARYDFGAGDYGIRATFPAGIIVGEGLQPYDIAYILEGSLWGYQLEIVQVVDSTHLRLEDVSSFAIAGVAEVSQIVTLADTAAYEQFTIDAPNGAVAGQADYFMVYAPNGQSYSFWLDIDGSGVPPTGANYLGADNQVMVSILSTDGVVQVAGKIATAMAVLANVTVLDNLDGTLSVSYDVFGNFADATPYKSDDSTSGTIGITITNQGVNSNLNSKYFLINSALDATPYYAYISVDSQGVDPLVPGKTAIPVAIAASASANSVATQVKASLDAVVGTPFATVRTLNTLVVTNTATGATSDTADFNTTFAISTLTQGITANPILPNDSNIVIRFLVSDSKGQYQQ